MGKLNILRRAMPCNVLTLGCVLLACSPEVAESGVIASALPLFDALLAQFRAQYRIDDKREFAAGDSSTVVYPSPTVGVERLRCRLRRPLLGIRG